jgi:ParB-like chromosome segregation protein Spo0J
MVAETEPRPASYYDDEANPELIDLPEMNLPVSSLVPGLYLRQAGTDSSHVRMLADVANHDSLPPILVQRHGTRIIDGMHRFEAAKLRCEEYIRARVIDCSDEDALVLAIKTNVRHGLPLSRADRISGAKRILAAHQDWSDRVLAETAGLSPKAIASLRNRSVEEVQFCNKRLGRDGKRRPVSAAAGRQRAAEYMKAHPEAPLREVAREADVSLGTVHDVRERIRRGLDLIPGVSRRAPEETGGDPDERVSASAPLSVVPQSPRAERYNSRHLAWPAISAKLTGDPALRYAEGGRAFLRWMAAHSSDPDEWREFIDAIPMHWARDISRVADAVSSEWREFAERLRERQATVG